MLEVPYEHHKKPACSTSYMEIFFQVIMERGINIFSWFENSTIDPALLSKFNGYVCYQDLERFVNQCPQFLAVEGLGLSIGEKLDLAAHGALTYAILSSDTYLKGFEVFRRYQKLCSQFIEFKVDTVKHEVIFDFTVTETMSAELYRFYMECALSGTYTFLKQYLSAPNMKATFHFDFPEPGYSHLYHTMFGDSITYRAGKNTLSFSASLTDRAPTTANERIYSLAEQQCRALLSELNSNANLVERIYNFLLQSPWGFPSQENIAEQLSMSIRTLRRRLSELGTDYQTLVDAVRETLAKKYLRETEWSIYEIGEMLGYSEATNFKRAFKRWTGSTPSEFRGGCKPVSVEMK